MNDQFHSGPSEAKQQAIEDFARHVSSGKAAFFKQFGLDFVPGRREGPFLWDLDGEKKLFNLHVNGGVFNLGHRSPEIIDVLKQGFESLDIGNHHLISRPRANLARRLAESMPGDLNYTVFGAGGGEAVDLAIKVARAFTGRSKIISAKGGYHGHTGLALATGDEKYRQPFGPGAPGFIQVPFNDAEALEKALDKDTAAVIIETVPATLGIVVPSPEYMAQVRALTQDQGVLLILDEIQTGLGRTGKLWGFQHFDLVPDIVVIGKGLSGGLYPISATVIKDPLEAVFHPDPFIHISTFGGAEIGCLAAEKVLEISSRPDFLERVNILAERFTKGLEELARKHRGFFLGVRNLGLMMGLKFEGEFDGPIMTKAAYDHGLLMIYANNDSSVCQFLPPLVMELDQVNWVLERLDQAMTDGRQFKEAM